MANTYSLDLEASSSQYAYAADNDAYSVATTGKLSIELWVKPESLSNNNNAIFKGTTAKFEYQVKVGDASGKVDVAFFTAAGGVVYQRASAASSIAAGQWYHIAATLDDSGSHSVDNLKVYINGVSITGTTAGSSGTLANNDQTFNIGFRPDTSAYYDGLVDEVRVWNDIRTGEEIVKYMNADVSGQSNLQGYWKLNNDYTDESSNGNDLTASGSPVFSTTVPFVDYAEITHNTKSLDLETSSSQYAGIADGSQTGLDITGDLTIEGWVKPETLPMTVAGKWNLTGNNRSYLIIISSTDIKFYTSANGTAQNNTTHTISLSTGQWYHIAVSYDASAGSATAYVNGELVSTDTGLDTSLYNGNGSFQIGRYNEGASGTGDGLWDEVRVWNDIRTQQEIQDFMFADASSEANLQGYWKLNGNYEDSSSNGNDLTSSGSPTFSNPPFLTYTTRTPKGGARDFTSASNQVIYITDANQTGLNLTGDFTAEAWVKFETLSANMTILDKWEDSASNNRSYLWQWVTTNNLRLYISNNGTAVSSVNVSFTPTADVWYHLACVYDASAGSVTFYVNGIDIGSNTGLATSIYDCNAAFRIGSYNATPLGNLNGMVSEVRVWDDIRTASEIQNNIFNKLTGTETNLQGYWRLDGDLTDETSNSNDLTDANGSIAVGSVPFPFYTDSTRQSALSGLGLLKDPNLQGYYKFDSGADTTDSTGRGQTLTHTNTPTNTTGLFNEGMDYEASSTEYSSMPTAFPDLTSNWTISAWVNLESLNSNIYSRMNTTSANRQLNINVSSSGYIQVDVPYIKAISTSPIALGTGSWYLITVSRNGNTWNTYVNGILHKTVSDATAQESATGTSPLIGRFLTQYMDGIIDDTSLFNRALDDREIYELYIGQAEAVTGGNFFLMF